MSKKLLLNRIFVIVSTALLTIVSAFCFACAADKVEDKWAPDIVKEWDPQITIRAYGFEDRSETSKGEFFGGEFTEAIFTDGIYDTFAKAQEGAYVSLSCKQGISSVYIEFDWLPEESWTIVDCLSSAGPEDTTKTCGGSGYLHEYQDLEALYGYKPSNIDLRFPEGTQIANIWAFTGEAPDWVQKWEPMLEKADLLLLSTHSDDEQLFFAGVLPYYVNEKKLDVQVVYFIQHFHKKMRVFEHERQHEQLNGLWAVGVTHYPYMSEFPDAYAEGKTKAEAVQNILSTFNYYGYHMDDFRSFAVEVFRKCKPLVVVTHDFDGEYGHPAHVICADVATDAVVYAADPEKYPESAAEYGVWQPQKVYIHSYRKNPITMDWDTPLESLGGKTPFEVTQEGFRYHISQHDSWFVRWIYGTDSSPITKATDIEDYSPCNYGLYFTSVGDDTLNAQGRPGDFMENISETYSGQRRAEEEARKKAEEEEARKRAEEEERRRQEEEEEQRRKQQEAEEEERKKQLITGGVSVAVIALAGYGGYSLVKRSRKKAAEKHKVKVSEKDLRKRNKH